MENINYTNNGKDRKARFLETSGVKSIGFDEKERGVVDSPRLDEWMIL